VSTKQAKIFWIFFGLLNSEDPKVKNIEAAGDDKVRLSNWLAGNNKGNKELLDQLEIEE
jgi:hypothetical protein